jgi:hypothetical protein
VGFEVVGLRVVELAVGLRVVGVAVGFLVVGVAVGFLVVGLPVVGLDEGIAVGCEVVGAVVGFELSDGAAIRVGKLVGCGVVGGGDFREKEGVNV